MWRVETGDLPLGLTLSPEGLISGTPTVAVEGSQITFQATETIKYSQHAAFVTLALNISPADVTIALTSATTGITSAQTSSLGMTTNDLAGVRWTVDPGGPVLNPWATMAKSGTITFDPAGTAGIYTVTATSITDPARNASIAIRVSPDPIGVSLSSSREGISVTRMASLSFNTNDLQGVRWSVNPEGPILTLQASDNPADRTATFDPAGHTGQFTITATSVTDDTKTASTSIRVSPEPLNVTRGPPVTGITAAQTAALTFSTNDLQGFEWSVNPVGPTLTPAPTEASSGVATFDPTGTTGIFTVNATSVTDPARGASAKVLVSPSPVTVSVTPEMSGITTRQTATLIANTNDLRGVTWSISLNEGSIGPSPSLSGDNIRFTAPSWSSQDFVETLV